MFSVDRIERDRLAIRHRLASQTALNYLNYSSYSAEARGLVGAPSQVTISATCHLPPATCPSGHSVLSSLLFVNIVTSPRAQAEKAKCRYLCNTTPKLGPCLMLLNFSQGDRNIKLLLFLFFLLLLPAPPDTLVKAPNWPQACE